jgi:two-component system, OmpR family, phosphate regulon sensor histidine kinase PhoR
MRNFFMRIIIVLVIVILMPVSFYFIKQLTNLSENEKIVKNVFNKQIETILFTLNQTSENIIQNWITRLDLPMAADSVVMNGIVNNLLQNNPSIYKIEFFDIQKNQPALTYSRTGVPGEITFQPEKEKLDGLKEMMKNGYQRIESYSQKKLTILYFLFKNRGENVAGILYIDTKTFIEQNLGTRFQSVAQDAFSIQIVDTTQNRILYSINDERGLDMLKAHRQKAWYLPGMEFRIQLRSATIDTLVKSRNRKDNLSFAGLFIIVLIGMIFLISTIKKEIVLAEMKSEFVSNVSHEIRTPLALISMYAETLLLKRFKTPEKEKEYLTVIHNESNRLSDMVNRILTFSRMEKMKRQYHFLPVDLNDLTDEVIYTFSPHLKSMNVEILKNFEFDIPMIQADREGVTECLVNLLDNAIKYGKETGKKIWIRTGRKDNTLFIDVEDNGIGISKKHMPFIFDKFYRVTKGNLAQQAKGTGIGLNIVKQIMQAHKGSVKVNSKPDEGSCFTLTFPINS